MAQASQPSADDLAYIRHLSESGARAPLIGGRFMAWWGLLLVLAYSAQHFATMGQLGSGPGIFGIIWGSFGLLGVGGQLLLARGLADKPGQGSAGNLAMRAVWVAGAFSIGAMVVGTALTDWPGVLSTLRARLAGFKVPRSIYTADELPMTATNRVQRAVLREWIASGKLTRVA